MKVFFHYKNCLIEIKDTNSAGQMEVNKKIETFETAKKEKMLKPKTENNANKWRSRRIGAELQQRSLRSLDPLVRSRFQQLAIKPKITPRIDTKASVYQLHLDWPIPRRQNASKAAQMKPVQRSGNPPKVFGLL